MRSIKVYDFSTATKFTNERPLTDTVGTPYCMAPEILSGGYGQKCDEWTVGVVMYMLLTGNPPFDGETDKEVLRNVRQGKFSLEGSEFENLSEDAMDLLKQLLVLDMNKRIQAEDAINHPWFL